MHCRISDNYKTLFHIHQINRDNKVPLKWQIFSYVECILIILNIQTGLMIYADL